MKKRPIKAQRALTLDFTKNPAQSKARRLFQPGNRLCNAWGRGTGKSWFARQMMYLLIAEWDYKIRQTSNGDISGVRIFYVFPTLKHFKRLGHAQNMLDELSKYGKWGWLNAKVDKTEWTFRFPGGSYIQVLTTEVSNRGARADVAILDEADEIEVSKYEAEIVPWFTEPHSLKQALITGTPMRGRYGLLWKAFSVWPNGDAEHEPVPGHYSTHATVYDADRSVVDVEEAERAKRTINPTRFSTEYLCNFDSGEGLVYPFFDVDFHVKPPPALGEFKEYIVGMDHGFEDPTVILVIGLAGSGNDTICHVLREEYMVGKSPTEVAARAAEVEMAFPRAKWFADHSPAVNKQIKDDAKVNIVEAEKGPGSVEDGVALVADALFIRESDDKAARWAKLYVDPSCKHTIDEFGMYRRRRDPKNVDRILDDIDSSKNDHCMDALRYALYSRFVGPEKRLERQLKLR